MGRRPTTGGVAPQGSRIRVTFQFEGKQVRPTLDWKPTKANMVAAAKLRIEIEERLRAGTFRFADYFPAYRFIDKMEPRAERLTFAQVADDYYASIGGAAHSTKVSYGKIIRFWKRTRLAPSDSPLGERAFVDIRYGELARYVGSQPWGTNKTRNNKVSVLKCVFSFGYADIEDKRNPADKLEMLKVQTPEPDPYSLAEALAIIDEARKLYGESYANYVEFQFFAGARPSETIALWWPKIDQRDWRVRIDCARVMAHDKGTTKTARARDVECCPRVADLLRRQFTLTGPKQENVFGLESGEPFHDLQVPWKRWVEIHERLRLRYREPYQARHTSVTWNLMIGKNLLWVAGQHGHSAQVMLKTYAKWINRTTAEDIEAIRAAFEYQRAGLRVVGQQTA